MKERITAILLAGFMAAGAAAAPQQGPGMHEPGHGPGPGLDEFGDSGRMLEHLTRRLDLDENQQQKIKNILDAARPELDALREKARTNRDAIRDLDVDDPDYNAKLNDLAAESGQLATSVAVALGHLRADVHRELTPEQRAELAQSMDDARSRVAERRKRPRNR